MKNMKKIVVLVLTAVMMFSFVTASATEEEAVSPYLVVTVEKTAAEELSSLSVPDGIFCGWYTTEEGAAALDSTLVAADEYEGTVYGAYLPIGEGDISVDGAQMRTESPYGIRFLATLNKQIISTVESLNELNCKGKNGSFNPANEDKTDIGYGMVLSVDVEVEGALEKEKGSFVTETVIVPGVYTYSEDETSITYTATVLGIDIVATADEIAARPYVTYADANGNVRTYYYSESGASNSAYSASLYQLASLIIANESETETAKAAALELLTEYSNTPLSLTTIDMLNTDSREDSADNKNAYLELDKSTMNKLDGDTTGFSGNAETNKSYRYNTAFYTRTVRVSEDLYLLLWHYGQYGVHLYYVTSVDGVNWGVPQVLYSADTAANKFTHTSGPLAGTDEAEDRYYAVNPDVCVLDDGTILCVYFRRPNHGYPHKEYTALSTLELVRGTVDGLNIEWSAPVSIYHGQGWEPEIIKRDNGNIEIYWSHAAPMIHIYGFQSQKRSSGVGMISSSDGGYTWTPNVTAEDNNHYAAKRIFQHYVGDMTIDGEQVPFYSGQMPGVVELTNGQMMVAVESEPMAEDGMEICIGFSENNGEWRELGIDEEGPADSLNSLFKGAAPTLTRFDSGEVLLSYNTGGSLVTRLLDKTGRNAEDAYASNIFNTTSSDSGFWSSSSLVDSHTAILSMAYTKYQGRNFVRTDSTTTYYNTLVIGKGRLNHTVNAAKKNVAPDGNTQEWANVNEALFVGSASNVQAAYRFAYDDNYIYAAIDFKGATDINEDKQTLKVAAGKTVIDATVYNGATLTEGVSAACKETEGGLLYEISFDRAALGLTDDSILVYPEFRCSVDDVYDKINGTDSGDTSTWLNVNLK